MNKILTLILGTIAMTALAAMQSQADTCWNFANTKVYENCYPFYSGPNRAATLLHCRSDNSSIASPSPSGKAPPEPLEFFDLITNSRIVLEPPAELKGKPFSGRLHYESLNEHLICVTYSRENQKFKKLTDKMYEDFMKGKTLKTPSFDSADGKTLIESFINSTTVLYDTRTKKQKTLPGTTCQDGKVSKFLSNNSEEITEQDVLSGKITTKNPFKQSTQQVFPKKTDTEIIIPLLYSSSDQNITFAKYERRTGIYRVFSRDKKTGKDKKMAEFDLNAITGLPLDTSPVTAPSPQPSSTGYFGGYSPYNGSEIDRVIGSIQMSPDGKHFIITKRTTDPNRGTVENKTIFHTDTDKVTSLPAEMNVHYNTFSVKPYRLAASYNGQASIYNFDSDSFEYMQLPEDCRNFWNVQINNEKNELCGHCSSAREYSQTSRLKSHLNEYRCFDLSRWPRTTLSLEGYTSNYYGNTSNRTVINGKEYLSGNIHSQIDNKSRSDFSLTSYRRDCNVKPRTISTLDGCSDCSAIDSAPISSASKVSRINELKALSDKELCSQSINADTVKAWNARIADDGKSPLSMEQATLALKKFTKPGGFDVSNDSKDLEIFLGIFNSSLAQHANIKPLLTSALLSLSLTEPNIYEQIVQKYLYTRIPSAKPDLSCLNQEEVEKYKNLALKAAQDHIRKFERATFTDLLPMKPIALAFLNAEQRDAIADEAADLLTTTMGDSYEYNNIFPSKIYKFAYNRLKKELELPFDDISDATITHNGSTQQLKRLFLSKPQNIEATLTTGGFYIDSPIRISSNWYVDNRTNHSQRLDPHQPLPKLSWEYNNNKFELDYDVKIIEQDKPIVNTNESPDYAELWRDGKFKGLLMIGSNMGKDLTDKVVKNYIEYYTEEGFEFSIPAKIENASKFLQSRVVGKEAAQYFIKEAHSDGDEKNLFRTTTNNMLLVGRKTVGNKTETIEIAYPLSDATDSTLLSNQEFGQWIQEREKTSKQELIYLNSSCWSKTKAYHELKAAKSQRLINIATETSMSVFYNDDENAMRIVVDGVRNKKKYSEIRNDLQSNKDYKERKKDVWLFPDEAQYQKNITDAVQNTQYDITPKIYRINAQGLRVPYNIDAAH